MVSRCAMFTNAICFSFGVKHKVDVIAVLGAIQAVAKEELKTSDLWGAFLESPEDFSDPKSHSLRLRHAHSIKLVFSYVVKAITIKIGAKFRASRRLHFEDTKRTISPEMRPKSLGTFEKRAPERD